MRDWIHTLRPASYKGVGFFVEDESARRGGTLRRTPTSKLSRTRPRTWAGCTASIASRPISPRTTPTRRCAALSICAPNPASERWCCRCRGRSRSAAPSATSRPSSRRLGKIELELEFVEAGAKNDTLTPPAPIGDRQAASALGEMPAAAGTRIDGLDETSRQGALSRRLDPAGSAGADMAAPANDDYQGGTADAAPRNSAFLSLFG
jgi:hypothetical protein